MAQQAAMVGRMMLLVFRGKGGGLHKGREAQQKHYEQSPMTPRHLTGHMA